MARWRVKGDGNMNCPKCGKEIGDGWAFCGSCGHQLDTDIAASVRPTTAPVVSDSSAGNAVRTEFKPSANLVKVTSAQQVHSTERVRLIIGACLTLCIVVVGYGLLYFSKPHNNPEAFSDTETVHTSSLHESQEASVPSPDEGVAPAPEAETTQAKAESFATSTQSGLPWNTTDANIQTNGNGKLAFHLVKEQESLAKLSERVAPEEFYKSPAKYIGKPIALTLRVVSITNIQHLPEVTPEDLSLLVGIGGQNHLVNAIMFGKHEQVKNGAEVTVYGYYAGRKNESYQLAGRYK